jgi:predicted AlkP superfamily pyrophosphatase or phosphodiesterase
MPCVVFVMIDGLRPDAVTPEHSPNLLALCRRGAHTFTGSSVAPSVTLPCHMSIFHSVPPSRHGVTDNKWSPMARPLPGLIEMANNAGKRCAFVYNWEPLRNVSQPGSLYLSNFRDTAYNADGDDWVGAAAAGLLAADAPDFVFVYFGTVDTAGHAFGWMSPEYLSQAARVDALLGSVVAALPAEAVVLVHADHGGHERTHGTDSPEDMTIPWVIAGPGIRQNHTLASPVSLLDTAPTAARLLGLTPHAQWEGRCVEEIFA